jgi:hypothetical protein
MIIHYMHLFRRRFYRKILCVEFEKKSVISNQNCIHVKVGSIHLHEGTSFINNITKTL